MGICLDSADLNDARRAQALGYVEFITTNPTLIAATGRPGLEVLSDLVEIFDGHVFYQVTANTVEARSDQAWEAHEIRPDKVVIKIPATTENMPMVAQLVASGIECAVTAVASPAQAYLAAQVNASFIAPYLSRLTHYSGDGLAVIRKMARIVEGTPTQILAASLKTVDDVVDALLAGAHHVTMPLDLILALGEHELSQQAIADFNASLQPGREC
jgi:transaldolase